MKTRLLPLTLLGVVAHNGFVALQRREHVAPPPPLAAIADSFVALNRPRTGGRVWADLSDSTRIASRVRLDRIAAWRRRLLRSVI